MERKEMRILLNDYFKDKDIKNLKIMDAYWGRDLGVELTGSFLHKGIYGLSLELSIRFIADDIDVLLTMPFIEWEHEYKVLLALNEFNRYNKVITGYVARNKQVQFKAHFNNVTKDNIKGYLDSFYKESYTNDDCIDELMVYFTPYPQI